MKTLLLHVALVVIAGCSQPSAQPTNTTQSAPAATPSPTDAASRADALLADMAKREAEYKKQEADIAARERLKPLPTFTPPPAQTISPPATPPSAAPSTAVPAATPSGGPMFGGHDEAWWKNEMRTADVRAADSARQLQQARDQQRMASDQMSLATKAGAIVFAQAQEAFNRATAEVNRLEAQVRNDIAGVERVREDARRADVPPGWLRWP